MTGVLSMIRMFYVDKVSMFWLHVNFVTIVLQVDLLTINEVTGVAIQGSSASGHSVTSFKVQFSPSGANYYTVQENSVDKVRWQQVEEQESWLGWIVDVTHYILLL